MRKWILPDSQKVYLNITKVYDDGTEKKQSMLLCFGEEEVEELKKKKEENKSTDDDYFYVDVYKRQLQHCSRRKYKNNIGTKGIWK